MIGAFIRDKAQEIEDMRRNQTLYLYYQFIMEDQNCSLEEAGRICLEDPAA